MSIIKDYIKEQADEHIKPGLEYLKDAIDSVFPTTRKKDAEIIEKSSYEHHMIIEQVTNPSPIFERDTYNVYDENQILMYKVRGTLWLGKHHLYIYKGKNIVGEIRKRLITFPDILEGEHKLRICKIVINENEKYEIRTYVKSKKRRYSIKKKYWKVSDVQDERAFKYTVQKSQVAHAYKAYTTNQHYKNKYVIGYHDIEKEEDLLLMTIALNIMISPE